MDRKTTLGALLEKAGLAPAPTASTRTQATAPEFEASAAAATAILSDVKRLVVRRERKGHGGHTATVIEGLEGSAVDAANVAKQLKRALGLGASVVDGAVVLQGDVVARAAAWLEGQGVRRVVRGN